VRLLSLEGQTFGHLIVLGRDTNDDFGQARWRCRCVCGEVIPPVLSRNLRTGHTTSCGCAHRAVITKHAHTTHTTMSRTYTSWYNMKQRCTNQNTPYYGVYGGDGVSVCARWSSFDNFLADMGPRPENTTLGRTLDLGDYTAINCFWMTNAEQALHKRNRRALLLWFMRSVR
jgi:hypothetical protein